MAILFGLAVLGFAAPAVPAAPLRPLPAVVPDGPITSFAVLGSRLYLGGSFHHVGPRTGPEVRLDAASGRVTGPTPIPDGPVAVALGDGAGGFFVGGRFSRVGDVPRRNLAHVLADGTVDPEFAPDPDQDVFSLLLDGRRLYAGGAFAAIGGRSRNRVAALDAATGAVDPVFDPNVGGDDRRIFLPPVPFVASQPAALPLPESRCGASRPVDRRSVDRSGVLALALSGPRLLIGGAFATVNGVERANLAAVSTVTGELDAAFDPDANNPGYQPTARVRRADAAGPVDGLAVSGSSLYLAGGFTSVGGQSRSRLAKLDVGTGRVDVNFDPLPDDRLSGLAAAGDRVYAAGTFTRIGGRAQPYLAALDAGSGIAVAGFDPVLDDRVEDLALAGGRVYLGGAFRAVDGTSRNRLAAVDAATGTLDAGFDPNADDNVNTVSVSGGSVFAGGFFASVGGLSRSGLAALRLPSGDPDPGFDAHLAGAVVSLTAGAGRVFAGVVARPPGESPVSARRVPSVGETVAVDAATGAPAAGAWPRRGFSEAMAAGHGRLYIGARSEASPLVTAVNARTGRRDRRFVPRLAGIVTSLVTLGDRVFVAGTARRVPRGRRRPRGDARDLPLVALDPATGLRVPGFHPRLSDATPSGLVAGRGRVYVGLSSSDPSSSGLPLRGVAALDARSGALDRRFHGPGVAPPTQLALRGRRLHLNTARERAGLTTLDARTGRRDPTASARVSGSVCALAAAGGRLYAGGDFRAIGGSGGARFAAFE